MPELPVLGNRLDDEKYLMVPAPGIYLVKVSSQGTARWVEMPPEVLGMVDRSLCDRFLMRALAALRAS